MFTKELENYTNSIVFVCLLGNTLVRILVEDGSNPKHMRLGGFFIRIHVHSYRPQETERVKFDPLGPHEGVSDPLSLCEG